MRNIVLKNIEEQRIIETELRTFNLMQLTTFTKPRNVFNTYTLEVRPEQFSNPSFLLYNNSRHPALSDYKSERADVKITLNNTENKLKIIDTKLKTLDPQNILNIGFSITYKNGKAIKNAKELTKGDKIFTKLKSGEINSIIE